MRRCRAGIKAEGLEKVLRRCLEKSPEDRYANVAELALALARFGGDGAQRAAERVWELHSAPAAAGAVTVAVSVSVAATAAAAGAASATSADSSPCVAPMCRPHKAAPKLTNQMLLASASTRSDTIRKPIPQSNKRRRPPLSDSLPKG